MITRFHQNHDGLWSDWRKNSKEFQLNKCILSRHSNHKKISPKRMLWTLYNHSYFVCDDQTLLIYYQNSLSDTQYFHSVYFDDSFWWYIDVPIWRKPPIGLLSLRNCITFQSLLCIIVGLVYYAHSLVFFRCNSSIVRDNDYPWHITPQFHWPASLQSSPSLPDPNRRLMFLLHESSYQPHVCCSLTEISSYACRD